MESKKWREKKKTLLKKKKKKLKFYILVGCIKNAFKNLDLEKKKKNFLFYSASHTDIFSLINGAYLVLPLKEKLKYEHFYAIIY